MTLGMAHSNLPVRLTRGLPVTSSAHSRLACGGPSIRIGSQPEFMPSSKPPLSQSVIESYPMRKLVRVLTSRRYVYSCAHSLTAVGRLPSYCSTAVPAVVAAKSVVPN